MPLNYPDILQHNNGIDPLVDSNEIKGGTRSAVANLTALYALAPLASRLKERATKVFVTSEGTYYELIDIANVGNSAGWQSENVKKGYRHIQVSSSSTWTINHNLGFRPNLACFDSTGERVHGTETHPTVNQSVVNFPGSGSGFGGEVICS
jgi:hypothetical protein